jgi:hypothetical protein
MADGNLTFRFTVLGRYRSRVAGNVDHVTIRVAGGLDGRMVYAGTLTMSEPEWRVLEAVLQHGLKHRLEIEDPGREAA